MAQIVHKINSSAQMMFDILHPVGEVYTQYPECEEPNNLYNNDDVQSVWTELNFDGAFFRADGGNASVFGSGLQAEGLPDITGGLASSGQRITGGNEQNGSVGCNGAFAQTSRGNFQGFGNGGGYSTAHRFSFTGSAGETKLDGTLQNDVYGKSDHVTPINYTIKVWKRTE